MTSIIVSSDDHMISQWVAQKAAESLGSRYVGPPLLEQVAEQHDFPRDDLRRALDPTESSKLPRKNRDLLLAHVQSATLEALLTDDVVCSGLAAHLYVRDVSHILVMRLLANPGERARHLAAKKGLAPSKIEKLLQKEKAIRSRWSTDAFGLDENDPSNYDMVLSVGQIEMEKIVEVIEDMSSYRKFQRMTYSERCLQDLALAAKVRVALLPVHRESEVRASGETAIVHVKCPRRKRQETVESIKKIARQVKGVGLVEVHTA